MFQNFKMMMSKNYFVDKLVKSNPKSEEAML